MTIFRSIIVAFTLILFTNAYANQTQPMPLVETTWLADNLDNVIVLDVRTDKKSFVTKPTFHKDKKTGKQHLARVGGHIPNAQLILYKNVRGDRAVDGKTIKHMVVSGDRFEEILQKAGVNKDSHIVITTNAESGFDLTMASRMFWQVKYFGHNHVSLLNGGTAQWIIDGREIVTSLDPIQRGDWQASNEQASIFASSDEVMEASENGDYQIIDVRPLGQYLGTFKSGKVKQKGHIPTARVFPVDLLSSRSTPVKFSSVKELQQLSHALGVDEESPLITYCNSGHMASGGWFVLHEILGNKQVKLYDGSMHQWTHENRPVVTMILE